ncbi:MAG TPA: HAMP domain-containing sensor histidine kinase [Candidatus Angelobacter sp.]|jgi:two-component system sensor histidine kinase CiaH|nr:HAMP domain-containing sensor histidine kinase [Candidatus Angelobacter sp.]
MSDRTGGPARRSALRVAMVATLIAALALGVAGVILDHQQRSTRTSDVDLQLQAYLGKITGRWAGKGSVALSSQEVAAQLAGSSSTGIADAIGPDKRQVTVVTALWAIDTSGRVLASTPAAPSLPADSLSGPYPRDIVLDSRPYRIDSADVLGGRVIAATDVGALVTGLPLPSSLVIGVLLLLGVFAVTLLVGLRAIAPVERARRAQLDFTADASHELRTPLSVIEAETALALRDPGVEPAETVLTRIAAEGRRLRGTVDGLLWLARYDSERRAPQSSPLDVAAVATAAVARFGRVAERANVRLRVEVAGSGVPLLRAPEEWMERLLGVLLDNACRVTPAGGNVVVRVDGGGGRLRLSVDDSGPGVPPAERDRILARFHRLDGTAGASGLGLAIADAVVQGTRGAWEIGTAPEGGASFGVSWPQHRRRSWLHRVRRGGPRQYGVATPRT